MSLTFLGWFFVVPPIAMLLLLLLRSRNLRKEQPDLETYKACLEDIGARLRDGKLNEAEADAARLALLSRPRSSHWGFGLRFQSTPQMLLLAPIAFLLFSGIGAAISNGGGAPAATLSGEMISFSEPDGEMLANLTDYARSIGTEKETPTTAAGEPLSDVNTMIERLAARLETAPQDLEGWQLLGWSYFHTARYEQAATAFGRALELDPGSAELKRSYEEAKAKASESGNVEITPSSQIGAAGKNSDGLSLDKIAAPEAMPASERDAAIRSMVDGLANRLESSPRDVDGWIHLMRSRVVLREREVAATAFRKALEVFADDQAASARIKAAAVELGLKDS